MPGGRAGRHTRRLGGRHGSGRVLPRRRRAPSCGPARRACRTQAPVDARIGAWWRNERLEQSASSSCQPLALAIAWSSTGSAPRVIVWWLAVVLLGVLLPGWALVRFVRGGDASPDRPRLGRTDRTRPHPGDLAGGASRRRSPSRRSSSDLPWSRSSVPCPQPAAAPWAAGPALAAWPAVAWVTTSIAVVVAVRWMWVGGLAKVAPVPTAAYQTLPPGPALPDGTHRRAAPPPRTGLSDGRRRAARLPLVLPRRRGPAGWRRTQRPRRRDAAAAVDARRAADPAGQPPWVSRSPVTGQAESVLPGCSRSGTPWRPTRGSWER